MEPIERVENAAISNSPTARLLQENMQAQADAIRAAARRALKKEKEDGGSVDGSGVSSDGSQMGEDLMGSMDPDLFGGRRRRGAAHEDQVDAELLSELAAEAAGEEEAEFQDDQDLEASSPPEEPAPDEESRVEAGVPAAPSAQAEPEPSVGAEVPAEPAQSVAPSESPTPAAAAAPEAPPTPEPPAPPTEGPEPPPVAQPEVVASVEPPPSTPEVINAPALTTAAKRFRTAEPEYRPPLPAAVAGLVDGLVFAAPGPARDRVRYTLAGFGPRLLSQCRMFDVRVLLTTDLPSQVVPSLAGDVQYDGVSAGYFASDRICWLHADRIDDGDEFGDLVTLTFASAIDHSMGEETFASRHSPAVQASYRACQKAEPGHAFLDGWCASSPQHYFAQGVAAWMTQPDGPLRPDDGGVYCSRSLLYDLDRSLYSYLEYLMRDTRSYG